MTSYTAADLRTEANERYPELRTSDRMLVDWVQKGLMDAPDVPSRGSGGGRGKAPGTWSENQRQLWLILLKQHATTAKRIATLCNIPVGMWLEFGDLYVPLRQVRKAMATWSKANKRGSLRASYYTAREMLDEWFDSPLATQVDRDRLVEAIALSAWQGRVDREALVEAIRRVWDPQGTGRGVGPAQILPESYALMIEARIVGIRDIANVPEDLFRFARDTIRAALEHYEQIRPLIASDPDLARVIEEPTLERRMNNACRDLAGSIGILLIAGGRLVVPPNEEGGPTANGP